jgi:type I restriction enzyme S subunit
MPRLGEQTEIVRRVTQLFTLADAIESRFLKAKSSVDKLTQSILAKAFRGELVPQDPNDEPASELLARIKQSAQNTSGKKRRRAT